MPALRSADDIVAYFDDWNLDPAARSYVRTQSRRYEFLLKRIDAVVDATQRYLGDDVIRILDIGPAYQTELLRVTFPHATVDSLGFDDSRFKRRDQDRHFAFDLNDAQFREKWPVLEGYHLVVLAEVIEHLYTSPVLVLRCVRSWIRDGAYLILQTPNACALGKRLRMLRGYNPFEMIRESREIPGHFREYTIDELILISQHVRLTPADYAIQNYFDSGTLKDRFYNTLCGIFPEQFHEGISICFRSTQ